MSDNFPTLNSAELAADRLLLLWQVRKIIMSSSSSDELTHLWKWDSILELLESHSLLIATKEDQLEIIKEEMERADK